MSHGVGQSTKQRDNGEIIDVAPFQIAHTGLQSCTPAHTYRQSILQPVREIATRCMADHGRETGF